MTDHSRKYLWTIEEQKPHERGFTQRLNPDSELRRIGLSRLAGLARAHVSLGRIATGKDSFAYHAHLREEEWVYILSGRGIAEIDGATYEVAAGDFMGFPTPGVAHLLRNPYDDDLVYLMGGEALPLDVLDYPRLGKRFLLVHDEGPPDFYELGTPTKPFGLVEPGTKS